MIYLHYEKCMFHVVPFQITCFLDRLANIRLLICVMNDVIEGYTSYLSIPVSN